MGKKQIGWIVGIGLVYVTLRLVNVTWVHAGAPSASAARETATVTMKEFLAAVENGSVKDGEIHYANSGLATLHARSLAKGAAGVEAVISTKARLTETSLNALQRAGFAEVDASGKSKFASSGIGRKMVGTILSIAEVVTLCGLFVYLAVLLYPRVVGSKLSFAKGALSPVTSEVRFSAVAGCDEAKEEVSEVVEFLKDPARFKRNGARMPKGVLLVGPPGTGKTMLAKAVAGEAQAKFYSLSGSDFVELYVGVGASRVRSIFRKARETGPSIIFIDEIDAVGRQRSERGQGCQEQEQTLNALLVEMDGFATGEPVIVFAATNRPDTLDKALLRPGRFDRQVTVGLPDLAGRTAILKVHAGRVKLDEAVRLEEVAKSTSGFSGADLANLLNEGALHASRHGRETITLDDLDEARDKVSWGREHRRDMTEADRRIIAYHEAGHALMQMIAKDDALKLHKVTIIPRGQSLGSTQFTPQRDLLNYSEAQLRDRIGCLMGGRAAEKHALKAITTGASGDIRQASDLARQMVYDWGMSKMGFFAVAGDGQSGVGAATLDRADAEVQAILFGIERETAEAMRAHDAALHAIAGALLARETISGDECRELLARNPAAAEIALAV